MTGEEALQELARSSAAALQEVLDTFAVGVDRDEPTIAADGGTALRDLPTSGLAASVAYVDGVTGGNVFVLSEAGAHRLASAMMGMPPEDDPAGELSELELSAIGEAMNQMMAGAAAATSAVLGLEVEIAPPEVHPLSGDDSLAGAFEGTAHATVTDLRIGGHEARYVQLVPHAFVVRMTRALEESSEDGTDGTAEVDSSTREVLRESLRSTKVRVTAELGRTRMAIDRAVGLPTGMVVELDRDADEPVDIYVNGTRVAEGRLEVTAGRDWAVRVERVLVDPSEELLKPQ